MFVGKERTSHSSFAEAIHDLPVEFVSATDGREALALIEEQDFVAVVLDVAMLAAGELHLLQRLLEMRPDIPLVVFGSDTRLLEVAGEMKAAGVTSVEVPSDRNELRSLLVRLLRPTHLPRDGQGRYAASLERARQCADRGCLAAAVIHLRNAIALNPERPEAYHLLGVMRERFGQFDLARKCYRIALLLDPAFEPAATALERLCILPHRTTPSVYSA
jgi:DNA-binding NtrC family response regulator